MRRIPRRTRLHGIDCGVLGFEYQLVDCLLLRIKRPIGREGAGDIRGVVLILAACVYQNQVAVFYFGVVAVVVQNASILACSNNRIVGRRSATAARKRVVELCLERELMHARRTHRHRLPMSLGGDFGGALH